MFSPRQGSMEERAQGLLDSRHECLWSERIALLLPRRLWSTGPGGNTTRPYPHFEGTVVGPLRRTMPKLLVLVQPMRFVPLGSDMPFSCCAPSAENLRSALVFHRVAWG